MNKKLQELIKIIECFEPASRFYWIKALKVSDATKGRLVVHFGL